MVYSNSAEENLGIVTLDPDNRNHSGPYECIGRPIGDRTTTGEKMLGILYEKDLSAKELIERSGKLHNTVMVVMESEIRGGHVRMYKKDKKTMFRLTKKGEEQVEFWKTTSWYNSNF